ncbi:MAG: hypothetical protein RR413_09815 [Christensenellaceae bacterium]
MGNFWNWIGLASHADMDIIQKKQIENSQKLDSIQVATQNLDCKIEKMCEAMHLVAMQQSKEIKDEIGNQILKTYSELDIIKSKSEIIIQQNKSALAACAYETKTQAQSSSRQEELLRILIANCFVDNLDLTSNPE